MALNSPISIGKYVVLLGLFTPLVAQGQLQQAQRIDQLVEQQLAKQGLEPNPPADDETFVRRAYLDIAGRIPTQKEAKTFLNYEGAGKRAKLIDMLMESDGFISHSYNYWADLLRAKSRMDGDSGAAYIDFLKSSVETNKPYDEFVRQLITADGKVWDNGAVGYYMRDAGMPLDNMSNTVRIFLGTRLECAQCHNHPFDRWTQMDYYKLAQFTYGVDTRSRGYGHEGVQELLDKDGKRRNKKYPLSGNARRALGDLLQPLSYGTSETNRQVKLPADYAYVEDGEKPPEVIAGVPFGEAPKGGRKESHREVYAKWLAGPENPRFTTVIANRMWKRALGFGLIEPVDDMKDTTVASNPELMTYLEGLMRNGNYDIKRFLRVVYNTRTYQREATVEDVPADKPYHFPGPLLRRMSAEQLWDSYVTLALPEPDGRKGNTGGRRGYAAKERVEQLRARDAEGILQQAIAVGAAEDKFQMENTRIREAQRVAQEAGDSEQLKALRKEMDVANKARREAINSANQMASSGMGSMSMMDMMAMEREKEMMEKKKAEAKKKGKKVANKPKTPWDGYGGHLMRASELPSPAPGGHFLREFGQSDRELIENSHQDTSVSQALSLLNGPVTRDVLNSKSVLKKAVAAGMSTDDKIDALFMSVLARKPSDQQREIAKAQLESNPKTGTDNLVWALVNTAEFAFVR